MPRFTAIHLSAAAVVYQAVATAALAAPIGPGDFGPDSTVLSFDALPASTLVSDEFERCDRVVISSTAPIGAGFSSDPADDLHPGEAISPFVVAITAVPTSSTSSLPNKVQATKYDAGGGIVGCSRCGIAIRLLEPLPTQVGLYISDPDSGQTATFSGPGGLLSTLLVVGPSTNPEFVGFEDPGGISSVVLRSSPSVGIGFDDLTLGARLTGSPNAEDALCAGDLNQDGATDILDVTWLRRLLVGLFD